MNSLVFSRGELAELRNTLLGSDLERGALLLAQPVRLGSDSWRLLVREIVRIDDGEYARQSHVALEIPPGIVARVLRRAREERLSIILAHTHPWDGPVGPSPVDREGEDQLVPVLFQRVPDVPHARMIMGRKDTHAALFHPSQVETPLRVVDVGGRIVRPPTLTGHGVSDQAFDRQVRAFGDIGQHAISEQRVSIVGLGGTGSVVAMQLAHLGVNRFLLVDPDRIEGTNLNRVFGATSSDIGRAKVDVAKRAILQIRPAAEVESIEGDIADYLVARQILGTDFFFSCTDSHGSRAVLTQVAYQYLLPGIDFGVGIHADAGRVTAISGRIQMLAPGLACTACLGVLDSEEVRRDLLTERERRRDPYIVGHVEPQPAVVSLNATVSGLAVTMFVGALTDAPLRARYQTVLFDQGSIRPVENRPDPACGVCSPRGFLGRGDSWPSPGRPQA